MNALQPLGDQAALAYFADEESAARFAAAVRAAGEPWLLDVVQAYTRLAVFFDPDSVRYAAVADRLRKAESDAPAAVPPPRRHVIPCCYELQLDLARVAEQTGLPVEEVVRLHAAAEYTVYAIGFC